MKIGLLIFVLALGTTPSAASSPSQNKGEVGLGEKLKLGAIQVRPLSVIEDSRCPADVKCSSANRIVVRTEVRGPKSVKTRDFEIGYTREIEGAGGLMLAEVSPSPTVDAMIAPAAYRFTYLVR